MFLFFQGNAFQRTLNRDDNKKSVYCQAKNRFTEILPENATDGRSSTYQFNVSCKLLLSVTEKTKELQQIYLVIFEGV